MESKIKIKTASWPMMVADLSHSNQFLKIFSLSVLGVCGLSTLLAFALWAREPIVLTLTPFAAVLERADRPKPEDEIQSAIRAYVDKRYKWEPATVVKRLQEAQVFVHVNSMKAYQGAIANVARFSTEKQVSQRVYPEKMTVNLEARTVSISGDRITAIQGLKAAGDLKLELSFESGPRTRANPWGIYITKEMEE